MTNVGGTDTSVLSKLISRVILLKVQLVLCALVLYLLKVSCIKV